MQSLIFTNHPADAIDQMIDSMGDDVKTFVLVDVNTEKFVLPMMQALSKHVADAKIITTLAGDTNKSLDKVAQIWRTLTDSGATRKSVLVNLGGGMITDMGGFAAATFKRGIRFLNVPTTLLGAVDASVGGKTGINFEGCKNEIGCFREADAVIISTIFFPTLTQQEMLSGYAEMLKHSLLETDDIFNKLMAYSIVSPPNDTDKLLDLLQKSVLTKQRIVEIDPTEKGERKALNLGHTVGHAFESMAMKNGSPIPHGYAVAWGLVVELVLSNMIAGFPSEKLQRYARYVKENYGAHFISCEDYPVLLGYMAHDKKNTSADKINFTLLSDVGKINIDTVVAPDQITAALDIYRDLMGI